MGSDDIILFHYAFSPYATRVRWYFAFRGIKYSQCMQSYMMPRPDVAALGLAYRRIPIVAIGRDVYLDSRLIFQKLDAFPGPSIAGNNGDQQLIISLLSSYITESGIFGKLAHILTTADLEIVKDPDFRKDREDLIGFKINEETVEIDRAEGFRELADMFQLLETTILADGRDWIFNGPKPSLGDIESIWPLLFAVNMGGILPEDKFSAEIYPKTYAWFKRFGAATAAAEEAAPAPVTLSGADAISAVTGSEYHESEQPFDESDLDVASQGLSKGDIITVGPIDFGAAHRDKGKLLSITRSEVVFEVATKAGSSIRVHAPRHGFSIRRE